MDGKEILVPDGLRGKLEEALEAVADLLAVTHQCGRSIASVLPYVAIEPLDDEARQWLSTASAIRAGEDTVPDRMKHALDLNAVVPLLADRLDGASLLAESLCQDHPTGKLHEFMRLFERAFLEDAGDVCRDLLVEFLGPLRQGYDRAEIDCWLRLRHRATHADRRRKFAVERDTRPVVNRMEQAAFDVLFNKEKWSDPGTTRRKVFNPTYGSLSAHVLKMFKTPEAVVLMSFSFFDGFSTYPLDLRLDLYKCAPKTWFTRTTDVREPAPTDR
jgi:hypothetical protein